jgi:hypothetical protein
LKIPAQKRAVRVGQVVKCLPNKREALSSNPSPHTHTHTHTHSCPMSHRKGQTEFEPIRAGGKTMLCVCRVTGVHGWVGHMRVGAVLNAFVVYRICANRSKWPFLFAL